VSLGLLEICVFGEELVIAVVSFSTHIGAHRGDGSDTSPQSVSWNTTGDPSIADTVLSVPYCSQNIRFRNSRSIGLRFW